MARIAYFDCFSGISGDMTLGAFIDAGLDIKTLERELKKLNIRGYELRARKVKRGELAGTKFDCIVEESPHSHRSLKSIITLIDNSALSKQVKDTARNIFLTIGKAEAKAHGLKAGEELEFHELGETDSIIDIVGTAIAIDEMGIDEICSSSVTLGKTPPAALELLKRVPVKILDIDSELVTPTGAGILKSLSRSFGGMPGMKISDVGYGAGTRDPKEAPNMLRLMIGERQGAFKEDRILVLETNIDDMSPQNFEYLFERLLKEGVLDVYTTNIQMKKSRPAFKLTVLTERANLEKVSSVIFSETTTIGIRFYEANRFKLERKIVKAPTRYGSVKVKVSRGPDNIKTVSPEYEECARLAREKKVPFKRVYDEAKMVVKI